MPCFFVDNNQKKIYNRIVGRSWASYARFSDLRSLFFWSVNKTANLEIERKYLVRFPDTSALDVKRRIDIVQTYLSDGENGSQRRVRSITENGRLSYTYTEKIFRSAMVRDEDERSITQDEYETLLKEKKPELAPVVKTRFCFEFRKQLFELDTYSFSRELAIMELELSDPEQTVYLPDNVEVIREVTGEREYSNSALANAGSFPADAYAAKGDN